MMVGYEDDDIWMLMTVRNENLCSFLSKFSLYSCLLRTDPPTSLGWRIQSLHFSLHIDGKTLDFLFHLITSFLLNFSEQCTMKPWLIWFWEMNPFPFFSGYSLMGILCLFLFWDEGLGNVWGEGRHSGY